MKNAVFGLKQMSKKSFILSSAGLKNLVKNQRYEDDFKFIFGEHEIKMENLFAEFISPLVSQIHQSDPTITSIHFYNRIKHLSKMSEEVFTLFESISKGESIEIDKDQCFQLQIISILLKNEEMFTKLDELFDEMKIIEDINFNSFLEMNSESLEIWCQRKWIECIASNLYSIDAKKIIDLPRAVFYSILTNEKLTIDSEDSLLDLIEEFVTKEETEERKDILRDIYFYEEVNFDFLSEKKFKEFIEKFDMNEMTVPLWNKIKKCFYFDMKTSSEFSNKRDGNGFYHQQPSQSIIVGGHDDHFQIGEKPNMKKERHLIISPPQELPLDLSSLLSYSAFYDHSVVVTRSGSLKGVGHNRSGLISSTLKEEKINRYSEFSIKDKKGRALSPVSAVCTNWSTLYMFSKSCGNGNQLVYCDENIKMGDPVFLDIGNHEPVSLFGGNSQTAAICTNGEIIFINRKAVINSQKLHIAASFLPNNEKATMVACLEKSIFALSSSGRVFFSKVESKSCNLNFSAVSELADQKIVWLSGSFQHCFAVSSDGRVFARGPNFDGRLGFNKEINEVLSFTVIPSLLGYKIKAAYAGNLHSLFQTREGEILACGYNFFGQLLLSSGPSSDNVYIPTKTAITSGATFCIVSDFMSVVFIGRDPPPNTPNMPVRH